MHRTKCIDYGIVLERDVEMELDGGERVRLAPGNVVVQWGAMHAWIHTGEGWARMVFAMVGATLNRSQ